MARRKKRKAKGAPPTAPRRSSEDADVKTGDERPPAPWGNFPLTQLAVLAGLVLIVVGLVSGDPALLLGGLLLGSLGGLELSIREHFAGYRSHTTLLAAVGAVAVALVTWFVIGLPFAVSVGLAAGAFVLLFLLLRQAFIRSSGGLSYKIR
ncbi:MAG: hypothetical protein ACO3CR_04570 [Solirubrobacterales bacterium]